MDQLYDPKLRTMSTTGSKILSWPVVSRNWGRRQHDVALPPFPYLAGGPMTRHRRRRSSKSAMKSKSVKKSPSKNGGHAGDGDADGILDEDDASGIGPGGGGTGWGTIGHGSGTGSGYGVGSGKGGMASGRRAIKPRPKKPVQITIRTKFPETFLWSPHLVAEAGKARISAELPHVLGQQELVLVASDKNGGVGVLRKRVNVDQPVFVQADFPEVLRHGETVSVPVLVTNKTGQALKTKLSLRLGGSISGTTHRSVDVPAGDIGVAVFDVRPDRAGAMTFQLDASAPSFKDTLISKARVAPGGAATASVTTGVARRGAAFKGTFDVPKDGAGSTSLSVAFPAVTSAFLGVDSLSRLISQDPLALASDLHAASLVLAYAKQHKLQSSELDRLDGLVRSAVRQLQAAQGDDGSFAFWRNQKASPYITAWVLEGMISARKVGAPVGDANIRNAAAWLANQFQGGRVTISDVSWWEGDSDRVRLGLTAEVFDVLSQVPNHLLPPGARRLVVSLSSDFKSYLGKPDLDPLTAGRAIQGLARVGQLDKDTAKAAIGQLALRRDRGHWEPSWFHAYGGNVEATVAMLAAMMSVDPAGFQAEKRDALSWLLATRDAWGQWHNERGTAQAIRALLMVGAPPEEVPGTVTVLVDGRATHTLKIDPADPFLSAIRMSQIDLGRGLPPGQHTVEVRYDGKLAPAATLSSRRWQHGSAPRAKTAVGAGTLAVSSAAPPTLAIDGTVDVRVDIARPPGSSPSILVAPSNLVRLDLQRLATSIERNPSIARYQIAPEGVRIDMMPGKDRAAVVLPYVGERAGAGSWPTVAVTTSGKTLRITPGAIRVR